MNDIVERLRKLVIMDEVGSDNPLGREAADAIEQRDATIARLKQERDEARTEAYNLKYAAAGGEDVPGSANAVTVADVERWSREAELRTAEAEARATAAETALASMKTERDEAREALKPFSNCGFNDNGDMTVNYSAGHDDYIKAYFVMKQARLAARSLTDKECGG